MRPGARLQAAIEVLHEVTERHRPADRALADWGRSHRFAGSGDRAAIGNLVFDALRQRASIAARMGDPSPRGLAIGATRFVWGETPETIASWFGDDPHAPESLGPTEAEALSRELGDDVADWVAGDVPEWLGPNLARVFGDRLAEEGAALARRAPVDLRVNTLKADRDKVLKSLAKFRPQAGQWAPTSVRVPIRSGPGKSPHVEAEPGHGKGWFEVQDEASQIAVMMAGAAPGMQVLDLCAGAGGKTLALAAAMGNKGQIYAYDADRFRLRPIHERLRRAHVRNAQVLAAGDETALEGLEGRMDRVFVDAPCTGSGVWRRRPDAKWRLTPDNLERRLAEQNGVLTRAAGLVKPGGWLVYATCSVLAEENTDQVAAFLEGHQDFVPVPYDQAWRAGLPGDPPSSADGRNDGLLLTPASHGTDGFYIAVLERADRRARRIHHGTIQTTESIESVSWFY